MILKLSGNWYILDIETTGLYSDDSMIIAIGLKNDKEEKIFFIENPSKEKEVLEEFKNKLIEEEVNYLIGYNISNFDIPFIRGRMLINGIVFKELDYIQIIDLLSQIKKMFRFRRYSLDYISSLLLNERKKEYASQIPLKYVKSFSDKKDKEELISYLKKDLELIYKLAERLEIFLL